MKFVLYLLIVFGIGFQLQAELRRIRNVDDIKEKIVQFGKTAYTVADIPTLSPYKKKGRNFIAVVTLKTIDRYYVIDTEKDMKRLIEDVEEGIALHIKWYYLDDIVPVVFSYVYH